MATHSSILAWKNPTDRGYSSWGRKESDTTERLSTISQDMLAFIIKQVFKFGVMSPSEYHRGSERVTQSGVGMMVE